MASTLWLLLSSLMLLCLSVNSSSEVGLKCVPYKTPLCRNLGYNQTYLANVFGRRNDYNTKLGSRQFSPLIKAQCSKHIRDFVCSVYVPQCETGRQYSIARRPCRNLCELVRNECEDAMNKIGFAWPDSLKCDGFPDASTSQNNCYKGKDVDTTGGASPGLDSLPVPTSAAPLRGRCVPFVVPVCLGLGYNHTVMPNILGHSNARDASLEAHQFSPLIKVQCSKHFQDFICSVYIPHCGQRIQEYSTARLPCRNLCELVKNGCEELMNKFGFEWPDSLKCERFPDASTSQNNCYKGKDVDTTGGASTGMDSVTAPTTVSAMCVPFNEPMCHLLGYSRTMMPNIFGHTRFEDASLELQHFVPVVRRMSSLHWREFLCSVYLPRCESTARVPCRNVCQSFKTAAKRVLKRFGIQWPDSLDCERFPRASTPGNNCYNSEDRGYMGAVSTNGHSVTAPTSAAPLRGRCVPFNVPLCRNMGYSNTVMPNILGHRNEEDAGLEVHQFFPLIKVQCSAHLKDFLCSVYFPRCDPTARLPCKNLCQQAQNECGDLMNRFGFGWPATLSCDRFPDASLSTNNCYNGTRHSNETNSAPSVPPTSAPPRGIKPIQRSTNRGGPRRGPRRKGVSYRKFLSVFRNTLGRISKELTSMSEALAGDEL